MTKELVGEVGPIDLIGDWAEVQCLGNVRSGICPDPAEGFASGARSSSTYRQKLFATP